MNLESKALCRSPGMGPPTIPLLFLNTLPLLSIPPLLLPLPTSKDTQKSSWSVESALWNVFILTTQHLKSNYDLCIESYKALETCILQQNQSH